MSHKWKNKPRLQRLAEQARERVEQGVGKVLLALPPHQPKPPELPWMIRDASPARAAAFLRGVGTMFGGDANAITIYVLNRWAQSTVGSYWTFAENRVPVPSQPGRAEVLLGKCLMLTRNGLARLAVQECGGDLEEAVRRAVTATMDQWGLDAAYTQESGVAG